MLGIAKHQSTHSSPNKWISRILLRKRNNKPTSQRGCSATSSEKTSPRHKLKYKLASLTATIVNDYAQHSTVGAVETQTVSKLASEWASFTAGLYTSNTDLLDENTGDHFTCPILTCSSWVRQGRTLQTSYIKPAFLVPPESSNASYAAKERKASEWSCNDQEDNLPSQCKSNRHDTSP
jgi:hypothetical protein